MVREDGQSRYHGLLLNIHVFVYITTFDITNSILWAEKVHVTKVNFHRLKESTFTRTQLCLKIKESTHDEPNHDRHLSIRSLFREP